MAIAFRGAVAGTPAANPTSGDFSPSSISGITNGDLVLCVLYSRASTKTLTLNNSFGFTLVKEYSNSTYGHLWIYRAFYGTPSDWGFTLSSVSNGTTGWFAMAFSGVHATTPVLAQASAPAVATSSTPNPPSVACGSTTGCAIVCLLGEMDDNAITATSTYTIPTGASWRSSLGTDAGSAGQYLLNQTGTIDPGTMTLGASDPWVVHTIALQPAGATTYPVSGTANASSGATGAVIAKRTASGSVAGASAAAGIVFRRFSASGAVAGSSGIAGAATAKKPVSGSVAGSTTAPLAPERTNYVRDPGFMDVDANLADAWQYAKSVVGTPVVTKELQGDGRYKLRIQYTGQFGDSAGTIFVNTWANPGTFSSGDPSTAQAYISGTVSGGALVGLGHYSRKIDNSVVDNHYVPGINQLITDTIASCGADVSYCQLRLWIGGIAEGSVVDVSLYQPIHEKTATVMPYFDYMTPGAYLFGVLHKTVPGGVVRKLVCGGSVAGTGGATGVVFMRFAASGAVSSVSGAAGAVTVVPGSQTYPVSGTVAIVSSAAVTIHIRAPCSGTVAGVGGAAGIVTAKKLASGTLSGISGVSGAVTSKRPASGVVAGVSGVSIAIQYVRRPASGSVSAVSGVSGGVTARLPATGAVAAVSGASGAVTIWSGETFPVSGAVSATSGSAVTVSYVKHSASGSVSGTAGAAISIGHMVRAVTGSAAATAGAAGIVNAYLHTSGSVAGSSSTNVSTTAARVVSMPAVGGVSSTHCAATGGVGETFPVSGTVRARCRVWWNPGDWALKPSDRIPPAPRNLPSVSSDPVAPEPHSWPPGKWYKRAS